MRGEEHKRRLEALKAKIVNSGGKVWEYTADWDAEKNCVTGLEELKEKIIFVLTCAGDFAIPARLKEKINYRAYALLASLADKDPVHKDEYAWFAWKCDKKADFLERIGKRTKEWWLLGYSYPVARGLYDICLQDQGRWLVEMLKEYTGQEAFLSLETRVAVERLFGILSKLFPLFFKTAGERKILIPIWEEALLVAAELAQRYHTENSIDNLKILAYKIGNAYEQCQMFEQALEYYLKTLEIYDAWGPGAVKAEKILEQIGDVYRLCGRYDRAWEYYRKAIEGNESQAKAGILFAVSADLVANYEKAVAFWKALGKHEEAATYQRKLNGIKELQERIAAERGDNLFSTFAFAVKIPFQDFMDDAAGHKHSGKIAEALQCCQGAFALLESERKKWNKAENWLALAELYRQLAAESESLGNRLLSQECARRSRKIEACVAQEEAGEWYYDLDARWQKFELD